MPTLTEKIDSREWTTGDRPAVTLHYLLAGVADDLTAKALLTSSTASSYDGLERESIQFEPVWVDTAASDGLWDCRVRYVAPEEKEPQVGESSFSFDTGGGTQHVTQSLQTIQKYAPPGKTAPDFKGAVGVTADNVEGVDITTPVFNFELTKYLDSVTTAYLADVYALTGKVNNAQVVLTVNGATITFQAGELLFLGASGGKTLGKGQWEITYRFAASPNRTSIAVGDITVPSKKGWEYLWVRYEDVEDATAKAIVKRPLAAYVEQVYETGDFSKL